MEDLEEEIPLNYCFIDKKPVSKKRGRNKGYIIRTHPNINLDTSCYNINKLLKVIIVWLQKFSLVSNFLTKLIYYEKYRKSQYYKRRDLM